VLQYGTIILTHICVYNGNAVKKMPCTIDLPEKMGSWGMAKGATDLGKTTGDLGLIAMCYLLQVGEYTVKKYKNETKQTEQFKLKDVTLFKFDKRKWPRRLGKNAKDSLIMTADGFTLKIGWMEKCEHFP
jgi:hypothetical protein